MWCVLFDPCSLGASQLVQQNFLSKPCFPLLHLSHSACPSSRTPTDMQTDLMNLFGQYGTVTDAFILNGACARAFLDNIKRPSRLHVDATGLPTVCQAPPCLAPFSPGMHTYTWVTSLPNIPCVVSSLQLIKKCSAPPPPSVCQAAWLPARPSSIQSTTYSIPFRPQVCPA